MDIKINLQVCFILVIAFFECESAALLRTPKVYNALITTDQNLTPSRAYPVIQPTITHDTPFLYNPYGYTPYGYYDPFGFNPFESAAFVPKYNTDGAINVNAAEESVSRSASESSGTSASKEANAVVHGGSTEKSPIPLNEFGFPPSLIQLSPSKNPINLAPFSYNSYPLIYDQFTGYPQTSYLPHFGVLPQPAYPGFGGAQGKVDDVAQGGNVAGTDPNVAAGANDGAAASAAAAAGSDAQNNSQSPLGVNGLSGGPIGSGPNGVGSIDGGPNGFGPVGGGPNGFGPNGFGQNGFGQNGFGSNGFGPNAFGPNGGGLNGVGSNGLGSNGVGPNGIGPNGIRPNGIGPNGIGSNGNGPNGPIGSGINGAGSVGDGSIAPPGVIGTTPYGSPTNPVYFDRENGVNQGGIVGNNVGDDVNNGGFNTAASSNGLGSVDRQRGFSREAASSSSSSSSAAATNGVAGSDGVKSGGFTRDTGANGNASGSRTSQVSNSSSSGAAKSGASNEQFNQESFRSTSSTSVSRKSGGSSLSASSNGSQQGSFVSGTKA